MGIDLGGNPLAGHFSTFMPLFVAARDAGMKTALHFADDKKAEREKKMMLAFQPDRLGHAVYMSKAVETQLRSLSPKIPVETCLSGHADFYKVPIKDNVFGKLFPEYPVSLNVDNPRLQKTDPTREYDKALRSFPHLLSHSKDIRRLVLNAYDHSFADKNLTCKLKEEASKILDAIFSKFSIER